MKSAIFTLCMAVGLGLCAEKQLGAQQVQTLDESLVQAGKQIQELKPGTKLAVLSFSSVSDNFSKYVIEELTGLLVQMKRFTIVDRQSLDSIRKEMAIQLSGEVSDESAQAVGRQIGAEAIIVGSLTNLGNGYRMWIKTLKVETGQVELFYRCTIMNDSTVAFLLHGNQQSAPPTVAPPAQTTRPASAPAPASSASAAAVYKVGDKGPAGGWIFYDKGNNSGGWRYLEPAPKDSAAAQWGADGYDVGKTGTEVGTGKGNTQLIVVYLRRTGETERAAQLCDALMVNGFDDWFLPSKDELNLMYRNLWEKAALGGFNNKASYWSSSQDDSKFAWSQRFSDGWQKNTIYSVKTDSDVVRAVRAF
jgi:TolB-like protein